MGTAAIDPNYAAFPKVYGQQLIQRERDVPVAQDGEEVAVAILLPRHAFAFTDSSYGYPAWSDPELELQRGTYRVTVRVRSATICHEQAFKLDYLADDFKAFRLEAV